MNNKISSRQFTLDCINKELEIVNSGIHFNTFDDLKNWADSNIEWWHKYSFENINKFKEWENYFYLHFYDCYPKRISKTTMKKEFSWFNLSYGFPLDEKN